MPLGHDLLGGRGAAEVHQPARAVQPVAPRVRGRRPEEGRLGCGTHRAEQDAVTLDSLLDF